MIAEYRDRLKRWHKTLTTDLYEPLGEISLEAAITGEQLSYEQAQELSYEPVEPGFTWGHTWEYCWFRGRIELDERAKGERIVLGLEPAGESTLFVNGKAFGTYRAPWLRVPHQFLVDNFLTAEANGDETYDFVMETYAGHYYPEAPEGGCATGPVIEGAFTDPLEEGKRRTLGRCTYGIWNEDAYQLYMDVDTLIRLLDVVDPDSLRAAKIEEALEKFTLIADFEQDREGRIRSYREAREALYPVLDAENGSTTPTFYAVGNSHLDLAWLWPMAETYRKTARTFAAQLRLMEEYPEYRYIQSQPASYEMCRKYYPELFERILEAIKGGQWIADGAMWVEPDTNMAGGEALVRQLLYGRAYYRDVLGVDSQVLWLPDTFGYTGALPQILQGCGVKYLVTQKIFWSYNEGEQFPYHYFNWEGIDGTEVTAFLPTSYNYQTDPEAIGKTWKDRVQKRDLDAFLLPFGYGDGGGGPTRDFLEYLRREEDLEGMPAVKQTSPIEFFEEMEEKGGPVNTYTGELYFQAHRGTYTSQAMVKKNNRRAELALRDMEIWGSAALAEKGVPYDTETAGELWKELLLHQFHDILPGSSIARVYEEAEKRVGALIEQVTDRAGDSMALLLEPANNGACTVFNSLSHERIGLVTLPEEFEGGAVTSEGIPVPVGSGPDGEVIALVTVPSVGALTLVPAARGKILGTLLKNTSVKGAAVSETEDGYLMENEFLAVKIGRDGEITSFVRKDSGREFAAGKMNHFRLFKDVPRLFDAWDIDSCYIDQEIPAAENVTTKILKAEGLEAVLEVKGTIGSSTYTQRIKLEALSSRVEFETTVDWKELHRLLKVSFPANVYAENGINEMQFGYVQRPTKRSRQYDKDRFEVCNHRYTALCDGSHGVAVLNDCKYGVSMENNEIALTLLRAAASPEMRADNRIHTFTYAFTAWEGSFESSRVVEQGYDLNVPLRVVPGRLDIPLSLVKVQKPNVILEAMKPAEDGSGDLILRFYESRKAAVKTRISTFLEGKTWLCDMEENRKEEIPAKNGSFDLEFGAFGIKTVRIERS